MIIGAVGGHQPGVEFRQAVDFRYRNQVSAPEPAAFSLDPSFFMRPTYTGLAVERIKAHVRPEQHPPIRLSPVAPEQNTRNRRSEVVIPDLAERYPSNMRVSFVKSVIPSPVGYEVS